MSRKKKRRSVGWHSARQVHCAAFTVLKDFITLNIIKEEKHYYLQDLLVKYKQFFIEIGNDAFGEEDVKNHKIDLLQNKILENFGEDIVIESSEGSLRKRIVYKNGMNVNSLINDRLLQENAKRTRFEQVAFELRNAIKNIPVKKCSQKMHVEDIAEGGCNVPPILFEFVSSVIQGPDWQRKNCNHDVRVESLCSDIIYIVSCGRVRLSKQMMLSLAMKSLTSSRKVATVLNKYGHCISYNAVEELETEMTFTAYQENKIVPHGISLSPELCTHVAFDNFDRFVDTINGKETLHDTVGIIYQFLP